MRSTFRQFMPFYQLNLSCKNIQEFSALLKKNPIEMNCESCGVVLAKSEEYQNMEYSPFSMLRKAYFELGHQHIDCPTDGGVKKKDVSKEVYKKSKNSANITMTIDDLYDLSQKKRPLKVEVTEDNNSVSNNFNNKKPPSLMRRKSSQLFIAFKTMNFLNANKKSNPEDITK